MGVLSSRNAEYNSSGSSSSSALQQSAPSQSDSACFAHSAKILEAMEYALKVRRCTGDVVCNDNNGERIPVQRNVPSHDSMCQFDSCLALPFLNCKSDDLLAVQRGYQDWGFLRNSEESQQCESENCECCLF